MGRRGAWLLLLLLLVGTPLAGCAEPCEVATDELSLVAVVLDNGETVRAEVELREIEPGLAPRSWEKCDGDVIRINGRDAAQTQHDGGFEYAVTWKDPAGADRVYTFEIDREDEESVSTRVTLPPAFDILAPQPGIDLSRASSTALEWLPALPDALMQINLLEEIGEGICLQTDAEGHDYKASGGVRVDDDGAWTIPPLAVSSASGGGCDAQYLLRRFAEGDYPQGLAPGGFVEARVVRSLRFTSVP